MLVWYHRWRWANMGERGHLGGYFLRAAVITESLLVLADLL